MAAVRNLQFVLSGRDASASKTLDKVGKKADGLSGKFGSVAGAIGGAALVQGLTSFGKGSVAAFKESEQSAAALALAFQKFPKLGDSTAASFGKVNEALAKKTKFDDDALASGQATLAQFNLTGKQIESVTPLLADYAAKTGQDLPSAATALGKAFGGNAKALKAIGINYKSTGDAGKDFTNIQALLSAKVGGFAANEGKTAAGQAEILKNQFGEVQEQVGAKLVPVLTVLASKLLQVIDFVQRNSAVIGPLVAIFGTLVAVVWSINKAAKAYTAVQAALNVVLAANPIGLVIVAIAALVAGLVIAYKKSETFRNIINAAFNGVKTVAQGVVRVVVGAFLGFFDTLVQGAAKAFGWVPGIGGKLKTAAEEFGKFKDRANASLSGIQDKEITVRIKKVGTGAEELARLEGEKTVSRRQGPMPGSAATPRRNVTANLAVATIDGKRLSSATASAQQGRVSRGYLATG